MRRSGAIILALLLGFPGALLSDDLTPDRPVTCREVLAACDEAVRSSDDLLKTKDVKIDLQQGELEELSRRTAELQAQRDSIWRNPWVWLFVGAAVGGLSFELIRKIP